GLKRDRDGLLDATQRIGLWNHYLIRAGTHDTKSCELANMLAVSALVATAALRREESRGTHFRTDHDEPDDARFCRHLLRARTTDGSISVQAGPAQAPSDSP